MAEENGTLPGTAGTTEGTDVPAPTETATPTPSLAPKATPLEILKDHREKVRKAWGVGITEQRLQKALLATIDHLIALSDSGQLGAEGADTSPLIDAISTQIAKVDTELGNELKATHEKIDQLATTVAEQGATLETLSSRLETIEAALGGPAESEAAPEGESKPRKVRG